MQNPRHFKVVMDSILCEVEGSNHFIWILRAKKGLESGRVQGHPGLRHLGTHRPVITFRHNPTITAITLSHNVRHSTLHTQLSRVSMWKEVFQSGQGPVLGIRRLGSWSWSLLCTWPTVTLSKSILLSGPYFSPLRMGQSW